MKIAVVGKGGSGKSSMAWLLVHSALRSGLKVLAVDADYNMDLAHNLGWQESDVETFLNRSEKDFYNYLGLTEKDYYVDIPKKQNLPRFSLSPLDGYTRKYSKLCPETPDLRLMVSGGINTEILYGHRCSHAYISALKYYLPLLRLKPDELVIVDSVAGTDMVSYGLYLGVDAMLTVVEPTPNSLGVFRQIKKIADEFEIPLFAVLNKVDPDDGIELRADMHDVTACCLGNLKIDTAIMRYDFEALKPQSTSSGKKILDALRGMDFDSAEQWERHVRWRQRYEEQLSEAKNQSFSFVSEEILETFAEEDFQ